MEAKELSLSSKTFILAFITVIWRRIWITSNIYCEHNNTKLTKNILLKVLKYNIFSDAGIVNNIEPYIEKALIDGFLMPNFYKKNIYATRAVELFKPAYNIIVKNKWNKEYTKFITEYTSVDEVEYPHINTNEGRCNCTMCDLIDSWDINVGLLFSESPFKHIAMKRLLWVIDDIETLID